MPRKVKKGKKGSSPASSLDVSLNTPVTSAAPSPAPSQSIMSPLMELHDPAVKDLPIISPSALVLPSPAPVAPSPAPVAPSPAPVAPSPAPSPAPMRSSTPKTVTKPATPHLSPVQSDAEEDDRSPTPPPPAPPAPAAPAAPADEKKKKKLATKSKGAKGKASPVPSSEDDDSGSQSSKSSGPKITKIKTSKDRLKITAEEEEDLVEWYRANELFYNKSAKDYRNTEKKNSLEVAKAEELGKSPQDLHVWRTSMRTQYGKLTKPGPSGTKKKNLTAREEWILRCFSFLKQHMLHKPGKEVGQKTRPPSVGSSSGEEEMETTVDEPPRPPSATFPAPAATKKRKRRDAPEDSNLDFKATLLNEVQLMRSRKAHPILESAENRHEDMWRRKVIELFELGRDCSPQMRRRAYITISSLVQEMEADILMFSASEQQQIHSAQIQPTPGTSSQPDLQYQQYFHQQQQQYHRQHPPMQSPSPLSQTPSVPSGMYQQTMMYSPAKSQSSWNTPQPSYGQPSAAPVDPASPASPFLQHYSPSKR